MSRPGTAERPPTASRPEEKRSTLPEAVHALCEPVQHEDELTIMYKKYWSTFDSVRDGAVAIPHDEYAVLMRSVLKLSGAATTCSNVLSLRLCHHDSVGRDGVKLKAFKARLQEVVTRLWPRGELLERLEHLYSLVTQTDPPDVLRFRSFSDVERDDTCFSLATMCPFVQRSASTAQNCFVITGDPCVGKTKLGAEICRRLGTVHLDTVSLVMAEIHQGSELGKQLQEIVEAKEAIPIEIQGGLIGAEIKKPTVAHRGFVMDEFPVMPMSAKGDEHMAKWVSWCGFGSNATHVVSVFCQDTLKPADEWTKCYTTVQKEWAVRDEEEMRLRTKEDKEDMLTKQMEESKKAKEGEGEEAGGSEEEQDENAAKEKIAAAKRRVDRRLLHDINKCVHAGRMQWFTEGTPNAPSWEGDTPFISPAQHIELASIIDNATARGCYYEVLSVESPENQANQVMQHCPSVIPVDIPSAPDVKIPEDLSEVESAEQEQLATLATPFSVWGKICPVTYMELGISISGLYIYLSAYKGFLYYFTTEERRQEFVANPDRYLASPPKLVNQPILLISKQHEVLDVIGSPSAVCVPIIQHMEYKPVNLDEYAATWKQWKDEQTKIEEERLQRELEEKQREAEDKAREKKAKKKKGDEKKKDPKKKKEDEVVAPPEPQEEEKEEEKVELGLVAQKLVDIEKEMARRALEPSVVVNGINADSSQWLDYLKEHQLLPTTVVLLDMPKEEPERPEDDDEEAEAEERDPDQDDAEDKPKEPPTLDMTDAVGYTRSIEAFVNSLSQEGGEEEQEKSSPSYVVHVVNIRKAQNAEEAVIEMSRQLNPFSNKLSSMQEDEEEGEPQEEKEEEEGKTEDLRLTPGPPPLSFYGTTRKYCPVSVAKKLLVFGDPEHAVTYGGKKWLFRGSGERKAFLEDPKTISAEHPIPPPAFWVMGTECSYQEEIREALEEVYRVPAINFKDMEGTAALCHLVNSECEHVHAACDVLEERKYFDEDQAKRKKQKEIYNQTEHEGDDQDEELENWEPEDEDACAERVLASNVKLLKHLIRCEPFASSGYVLHNVPTKEEHLDVMNTADVIPEVLVHATLSKETYLRRRLPGVVEERSAIVQEKTLLAKQKQKEKALKNKEKALERWRRRNIGGDEEDEAEEEEEETVAPVSREEVSEELGTAFDEELSAIEVVITKQIENRVTVTKVDAEATVSVFISTLMLRLKNHLAYRASLFCCPYLTTKEDAALMLQHGKVMPSPFGKCDPVEQYDALNDAKTLYQLKAEKPVSIEPKPQPEESNKAESGEEGEGEAEEANADPEPTEEELEELHKAAALKRAKKDYPKPVVSDGKIYYCNSEETLLRFLEHPLRYVEQEPLLSSYISADPMKVFREQVPVVVYELPLFIAVVDQPKSDSRSLGEHLAYNLNAVHISKRKLVKSILTTHTVLAEEAMAAIKAHKPIDASLMTKMLLMRLGMEDVTSRGCVLDGVCNTAQMAELIYTELAGVCPLHNVLIKQREELLHIARCFTRESNNVTFLEAGGTMLTDVVTSMRAVAAAKENRRALARRRFYGLPANLVNTAQPIESIIERLSKYQTYCAWEWIENKCLVNCREIQHCAEYGDVTYCFSSEKYMTDFLLNPSKYEDFDNQYTLPSSVPQYMDFDENNSSTSQTPTDEENKPSEIVWQFEGFCPVTLYTTRNTIGLKGVKQPKAVEGLKTWAVGYKNKAYKMASEELREMFMKQPWLYIDGAVMPSRVPVQKELLGNVDKVSMQTYVNQTLYEAVAKAMLAVGDTRPGFPGSSVRSSALRYIATHLKAHNPKNTPLKYGTKQNPTHYRAQLYTKNLEEYTEACSLADFFLSNESAQVSEETRNKKVTMWDAIQKKELCPDRYEQFNIGDLP